MDDTSVLSYSNDTMPDKLIPYNQGINAYCNFANRIRQNTNYRLKLVDPEKLNGI